MHPHGPPGTHTPPSLPHPDGHTHTHTHTRTRTRTRTPGSDRRTNSQDLQVTQRSEGSIFNAADVVVVQLPVEKQGGEHEGLSGASREPGGPGRPVPERSAGPSTLAGSAARRQLQPVCQAAASPPDCLRDYTDERTKGCQISANINCAFFFFFLGRRE